MISTDLGSGASGSVSLVKQLEERSKDGVTSTKTKMRAVKVGSFGDHELTALQAGIKNIPKFVSKKETAHGTAVTMQLAKIGDVKKTDLLKVAEGVSRAIVDLNDKFKSDGKLKEGERLIHQDIKPQNIGMTKSGKIKLLDWGSAKIIKSGEKASPTAGATPLYIPPEACTGSSPTGKNDSWALGATLFKYATGRNLLARDNPIAFILSLGTLQSEETLQALSKTGTISEIIASTRKIALKEFNDNKIQFIEDPEIDEKVKVLVLRLLEINPEERLSLEEALELIEKFKKPATPLENVTPLTKLNSAYTLSSVPISKGSKDSDSYEVEEDLEHSVLTSATSYSGEIFEVETADDCLVAELTDP
jgi:serine/threonine protein kinase